MKRIIKIFLCFFCLFAVISLSGCLTARKYNLSLANTVSVFMLNNEKGSFFCIPVQYMGDYHIGGFNYTKGFVEIGGYKIPLNRKNVNISVYLNEETDEAGSLDTGFNLVYLEEKGKIAFSKMKEPLAAEQIEDDGKYAHYYIFIERFLSSSEMRRINSEYEKGNINSRMEIWYDIIIDNELQSGSGMLDNFELSDKPSEAVYVFPNLNFFRAKYL
ncbi:MAG: hypothetical protein FWC19_08420 [Treponema sp.]|nr:hypothetical protein [Treponema sp.]